MLSRGCCCSGCYIAVNRIRRETCAVDAVNTAVAIAVNAAAAVTIYVVTAVGVVAVVVVVTIAAAAAVAGKLERAVICGRHVLEVYNNKTTKRVAFLKERACQRESS